MQRAVVSSSKVRRRLLTLIDRNLARRSGGDPSATLQSLEEDLDEEVLVSVARRVHEWSPPWKAKGPQDSPGHGDLDLGDEDLPGGLGGGL